MSISRRTLLSSAGAASAVVAFDLTTRTWLSHARADAPRVPRFEGRLTFDASALAEASSDFGAIVRSAPWAVLEPASADDIVKMVRFANRHRIPIAMRGQAHSVFGQAQAPGGVVIDSRTLDAIRELGAKGAVVEAGVTWRTLVEEATALGLTPPVLTDYLDLSIGGVLSVGGIGGATHRYGFVADTCLELTVVTGEGELVRCSASRQPLLFRAVLGGLGQFAIIVEARIALAPARPLARVYQLAYADLGAYLRDQRTANAEARFDFLQGLISPLPEGGFQYVLQGASWFDPSAPPDDARALAGLSPLGSQVQDLPYVAWLSRVDAFVAAWQAAGVWTTPHPWSDLFLPDDAVESYVAESLQTLRPEDVGAGVTLLYPFKRSRLNNPLVRVPNSETVWLFDILRFAPPDPARVEELLADNRTLLDRAVAVGGKRYPISAVPLGAADYPQHYGIAWWPFVAAKRRWDPRNVLTPGQKIFRR
jgi:cytokinin dehydrogenase